MFHEHLEDKGWMQIEPHAVLDPADADLSHITSPRIRKPISSIMLVFTYVVFVRQIFLQ